MKSDCPPDLEGIIRELYVTEYDRMIHYASVILKDASNAEVAVQETFVAALSHKESFFNSPNRVGWLYTTLKNTIRHILRERNKLVLRVFAYDAVGAEPCCEDEYSLIPNDIKDSEEYRLLVRFYLGGYSIKELAREYEITVGACKMRIKRARAKLRVLLDGGDSRE